MNVKYRVKLTTWERVRLASLVLGGKGAFRRLKRAQILLAADREATERRLAATSRWGLRRCTDQSSASSKKARSGR